MTDFDVIIVGGGMVGGSLACALSGHGLRIAMVEAVAFKTMDEAGYDDRSVALSYGSKRIFDGLEIWQDIQQAAVPIKHIHISDRGHFGMTHLDCRQSNVPALGYVVENRVLGQVLHRRIKQSADVALICPATVKGVKTQGDAVIIDLEQDGQQHKTITASLLVAADGGQSAVRNMLGIHARTWDYGQQAIIANVTPQQAHNNVAYERFTESGPLALLPLSDGRCSMVWTVEKAAVDDIMALDDEAFLAALQQRFGQRLGAFIKVGKRVAYPLALIRSEEDIRPRIAIIGNAAHTLHPVAGQGFNLGLRDVAVLAELLIKQTQVAGMAGASMGDLGADVVLQEYASWRRNDQRNVAFFTDSMVRIFTNPLPPIKLLRNLGLMAVEMLPPLKRIFAHHTMGLSGRQPMLARGLKL